MALIANLTEYQPDHPRRHNSIDGLWTTFDVEGETILQLRTDGSQLRQFPGKASQMIQFNQESAASLLDILLTAFPGLRDS